MTVPASFVFNSEANRFLLAQRGDLTALASARGGGAEHLKTVWAEEAAKTIVDHVRMKPKHVLDIGAGLGVIDMALNRMFGTYCTLVDGEAPPDGMAFKHDVPFCSRCVVDQFWADNGNTNYQYLSPPQVLVTSEVHAKFDLVLSLRSWCFHYPPSVYGKFVQEHVEDGAVVLLDVRRNRLNTHAEWLETLVKWWPSYDVVETSEKYARIRFVVGGGSYE